MKKHFYHVVSYLIGCFCILQLSANQAQFQLFLAGHNTTHPQGITLPQSKEDQRLPFDLGIAMELTDEDHDNGLQRSHDNFPVAGQTGDEWGHTRVVKTRIRSQRIIAAKRLNIPLFILFHTWKSDLA